MFFDYFKQQHIIYIWLSIEEYKKHEKEYESLAIRYCFNNKEVLEDKVMYRRR